MLQERLKNLRNAAFSIDELVDAANALLPELMPADMADQRVREDISIRLVRHYTTAGLVDDPAKEGREARYEYRHLLQILVLRRMQAEGVSSSAMLRMPRGDVRELERMLDVPDPARSENTDNEALRYLQQIRQRAHLPPATHDRHGPASNPKASSRGKPAYGPTWTRVPLLPGLELHVRDDFEPPNTSRALMDLQVRMVDALDRAARARPRSHD